MRLAEQDALTGGSTHVRAGALNLEADKPVNPRVTRWKVTEQLGKRNKTVSESALASYRTVEKEVAADSNLLFGTEE